MSATTTTSALRLLLGAGLGAGATWLLFPASTPAIAPASPPLATAAASSAGPASQASFVLPAWSWRDSATPPVLTESAAARAIAAWLAWPEAPSPEETAAHRAARAEALRALLVRLPDGSLPALADAIQSLPAAEHDPLRRVAFDAWTERDPAAATLWTASEKSLRPLAKSTIRAWAARDVMAALAWATARPDSELAQDLSTTAADKLTPEQLPRALALLEPLDPTLRAAVFEAMFTPLARSDPAAAVRAFGPRLWQNAGEGWPLQSALRDWAKTDLPGALAWLRAQPRLHDDRIPQFVMSLTFHSTPETRAALASAVRDDPAFPRQQAALASIFRQWSSEAPDAALAWLDTVQDRHLRNTLLDRATRGYDPDHPEKNLPLLLARPDSPARTQSLGQILGAWAKKSPSAALAWMNAQTSPAVAAAAPQVHAAILGTIARDEPQTALAEWAALQDPRARAAALGPIAEGWGQTDPKAALAWVTEQSAQINGTLAGWQPKLLAAWARTEPLAALRWAEDQPRENQRLGYLRTLAGAHDQRESRVATADLYAQIRGPELRARIVTEHLREWLTKDRPAATTWLESNDILTPAQAAALLATP